MCAGSRSAAGASAAMGEPLAFLLSWAIGGHAGGHRRDVTWAMVERHLRDAVRRGGVVELDTEIGPHRHSRHMQLRADRNGMILTLGAEHADDHVVRTWWRSGISGAQVEILGDLWDCGMILDHVPTAISCFREFFETGDVAGEILT